jgi:hypothetical protein
MSIGNIKETLRAGSLIEFEYPAANYHAARTRWEQRRLRIDRVRDVVEEPLDPLTTTLDPHLRRGQHLVTGLDLDKGEERSFYLESMREIRTVDPYPVGYSSEYSVVLVDCDDEWTPAEPDLPLEFIIRHVIVTGISRFFAEAVAEASNRQAMATESRGRWAVVLPPGWAIPSQS